MGLLLMVVLTRLSAGSGWAGAELSDLGKLGRLLGERSSKVFRSSQEVAGAKAQPMAMLLAAWARGADPESRLCALRAMGAFKRHPALVREPLLAAIRSTADELRYAAASSLEWAEDFDDAVVSEMAKLTTDRNGDIQWTALVYLSQVGAAGRPHLATILPALRSPHQRIRAAAVWAICEIDGGASVVIGELQRLCCSKVVRERKTGLAAIAWSGNESSQLIDLASALLFDRDDGVREYAAQALHRIGRPAYGAANRLRLAGFDSSPAVRSAAGLAIAHVLGTPLRQRVGLRKK